MADRGTFPSYECIADSEIDGDEERFTVHALIAAKVCGHGVARSKRLAEREAAAAALKQIDNAAAGKGASSEEDAAGLKE